MENLELYKQLLIVESTVNIWKVVTAMSAGIIGVFAINVFSVSTKKRLLAGTVGGLISAVLFIVTFIIPTTNYTAQLSDITVNLSETEYGAIKSYQDKNSLQINEFEVRSLIKLIINDNNRFEK